MRYKETGIATRQKIMDYLIDYKLANDGNSPTLRKIQDACDISSLSTLSYHLRVMEDCGTLRLLIGDKDTMQGICINGGKWRMEKI